MCRATMKALTNAPSCSGSNAPKASLCSIVDMASSKLVCRVAKYNSDAQWQAMISRSKCNYAIALYVTTQSNVQLHQA
jgi:hypothetical protein